MKAGARIVKVVTMAKGCMQGGKEGPATAKDRQCVSHSYAVKGKLNTRTDRFLLAQGSSVIRISNFSTASTFTSVL